MILTASTSPGFDGEAMGQLMADSMLAGLWEGFLLLAPYFIPIAILAIVLRILSKKYIRKK